jgi:uncharacterized protein (TIGR02453 family)
LSTPFIGFSEATIQFLWDLRLNNNQPWFAAHENDYRQYLLEPLKSLVTQLSGLMSVLDPFVEVTPAINKTISRINRDTRFSKDKSPYKDRMWITFKRRIENWQDSPGYFFEITPESYRYGMGFYLASKDTMDAFRKELLKNPDDFLKTIAFLENDTASQGFRVEGERYKRVSLPEMPEELTDWFYLKNLFVVCNHPIDQRLFDKELVNDLENGFNLLYPLYTYLWKIKAFSNQNKEMIYK